MSRHTLHSEENFWPCVSDMFLALFVIALLMYSQTSNKKGEGDLLIADQASKEAVHLIEQLYKACPDDQFIIRAYEKRDAINEEVEGQKLKRPHLANAMYELARSEKVVAHPANKTDKKDDDDHDKAIDFLYKKVFETKSEKNYTADEKLRQASAKILEQFVRDDPNVLSREKLAAALQEARKRIQSQSDMIEELKKENQRLREKLQDQNKLKNRIEELEKKLKMVQSVDDTISDLQDTITQREEKIRQLEEQLKKIKSKDIRALVMSGVEEKVKEYGLEGKVMIEKELGVLRIPSDSVGFKKKKATVSHGEDVLKKLSDILIDIARENTYTRQIDNIVIECHADTEGDAEYNEGLSSKRAMNVWFKLNGNGDLQNYKNGQGLGLFSHAGFGARVPLNKEENESKSDWWSRCRRIDIRFNCSPVSGID